MTNPGPKPWRRVLRIASLAALPVLATAIAGGDAPDSTAPAGGHDHARMPRRRHSR